MSEVGEREPSIYQELEKIRDFITRLREEGRIGADFEPRKKYFVELVGRLREAESKGEIPSDVFDESVGELIAIESYISDHDALTGLPNYRGYQERIKSSIASAERHKMPLTLMVFDIDHFKQLNDELGHDIGNLFLISLATLLQEELRRGDDFLARYGGEEFVIILPNTDREKASVFAEKIRGKTAEYLNSSVPEANLTRPVTISVGVGQWQKGQTPEALFSKIDDGLREAKETGRNRVVVVE